MYRVFEHTADLGLRVEASTLEELLVEAARGLVSLVVANPDAVLPVVKKTYEVAGTEPDLLLFDWLTELLYTFDTERILFSQFDIRLTPAGLTATCRGETANPNRHRLEHEIKAITYHGLFVRQTNQHWEAEFIVDI
jgi:SHS2 domain-containing protein